jgi:hypothetical protein
VAGQDPALFTDSRRPCLCEGLRFVATKLACRLFSIITLFCETFHRHVYMQGYNLFSSFDATKEKKQKTFDVNSTNFGRGPGS